MGKSRFPQRKSIRLKRYDYSQQGLYFLTIVTKNRKNLFGEIKKGEMILNNAGKIAKKYWFEIPDHFPNTRLHEYIIMPNHIHGIIEIVRAKNFSPKFNVNNHPNSYMANKNPTIKRANNNSPLRIPQPFRSPSKTIGSIIRGYKIGVTKWFLNNYPDNYPIGKSIWQRNYWEHIIRNENEYIRISEYIINNPAKWENDRLNNDI